ncbi:MAG: hypothetical protein V4812_19395 [Pseudomonadota bacterium]
MKIICEFCNESFEPNKAQCDLIEKVRLKGAGLVMLECPHCYADLTIKSDLGNDSNVPVYRCPVIGCTGWVSYAELDGEGSCFGCGECGSIWKEKKNLDKYIADSIRRYSYRQYSYNIVNGEFFPGKPEAELSNYEDLVELEPKEFGDDFIKG